MSYSSSRSYGSSLRWNTTPSTISSSYNGGYLNSKCLLFFRCCGKITGVITVEPVVFFYVFSAYLYVAMLELYAFNRYGKKELEKSSYTVNACVTVRMLDRHGPVKNNGTGNAVQGSVAILNLYVGVSGHLPSIFAALILGPLSDKYGRKPAMGLVVVGILLQAIVASVILSLRLSLYYFSLSSALRSVTGGLAGILATSYSYIVDISPKKWLTLRLGILEAVTFIAASLGFGVVGGWIQLDNCRFVSISWMVLAIAGILVLYFIIFFKESTNRHQTARRRQMLTTGPRSLLTGFKLFTSRGNPRWKLWFCVFVLCITVINQVGTLTVITLFLLHTPLEWNPGLIGSYLSASELIHGLSLIIILPIMVACSLSDPLIVLLGVVIACATNVGLGFITSTWQMFVVGSIQSVDAIIAPALKAIMSKLVQTQDQGALFSLISTIQVICGTLAFVLYSITYKLSLDVGLPIGSSFWLMSILYGISLPMILALRMFHNPPDIPSFPVARKRTPSQPQLIPSQPKIHQPSADIAVTSSGLEDSVEWALSKSAPRLYPQSPASAGQDVLERRSLLGPHPTSISGSYGRSPISVNGSYINY